MVTNLTQIMKSFSLTRDHERARQVALQHFEHQRHYMCVGCAHVSKPDHEATQAGCRPLGHGDSGRRISVLSMRRAPGCCGRSSW
jgi:hypothetical protein